MVIDKEINKERKTVSHYTVIVLTTKGGGNLRAMYVHLSVAAPQEFMSFLPFFLVDIRTAQTLRLERYITPVYMPQTTGNWGIDKEII